MDSFKKDTHSYAFAMVNAPRSKPAEIAEKLDHIKQLRFNVRNTRFKKKDQQKDHLEINF